MIISGDDGKHRCIIPSLEGDVGLLSILQKKCACMIVTWMYFILALHLSKDITGVYNPACVNVHPLCHKDPKSCLWFFGSTLQHKL